MSDFRDRLAGTLEERAARLPGALRVPTEAERAATLARIRGEALAEISTIPEEDPCPPIS